jgi:hypothetical protein
MSSACYTKYADAKLRREVLSPLFSRSSILKMQGLIQERVSFFQHIVHATPVHVTFLQMNVLYDALAEQNAAGKSSNLYLGFRCFATDVVMLFCYNKSLETTKAPDFHADIVVAAESLLPILSLAKYSRVLRTLLHYFPPWLGKKIGPPVMSAFYQFREVRFAFLLNTPPSVACHFTLVPGGADLFISHHPHSF